MSYTTPDGVFVIEEEKPQQCDLCGKIDELRPYGPNGECVCYDCGMDDPDALNRAMFQRMMGAPLIVIREKCQEHPEHTPGCPQCQLWASVVRPGSMTLSDEAMRRLLDNGENS